MSDTTKFCLWCATFAAITLLVFLAYCGRAYGADDPLGVGHTHEGDVGQFYQSWLRPGLRDNSGARYSSCCGQQDCRPILQIRKHPSGVLFMAYLLGGIPTAVPATWEVLIQVPYDNVPKWIAVADSVWEDNQPDPRESPNEHGHACATYSGFVICAVRASGQ